MSFIKYIADENHYKDVLSLVGKAKQTVWIGFRRTDYFIEFCQQCKNYNHRYGCPPFDDETLSIVEGYEIVRIMAGDNCLLLRILVDSSNPQCLR